MEVHICLHCQVGIILDLKLFLFIKPKITVSISALPSSVTLFLVIAMLAFFFFTFRKRSFVVRGKEGQPSDYKLPLILFSNTDLKYPLGFYVDIIRVASITDSFPLVVSGLCCSLFWLL